MEAYHCEADHVYVVTLSSKLSGSYNSAELGKKLYHEKYGEKDIFICDSQPCICFVFCGQFAAAIQYNFVTHFNNHAFP